ncbi:hypothetical protein [Paenibacillus sp. CECT 9249]|uniref:hypothetical protein n=1 Tax=Paenibacillus sp. CECT 9249 TaxID=2845385 RepID=UPI001E5E657B|nr:hypothetical protein [Paenibacillus sp. CECT 9249]
MKRSITRIKPASSGQKSDGQKPRADSGDPNSGAQIPQSNTGNQKGANEKPQSNNTTKEAADSPKALVIDDYMTMDDLLGTFTAFVNRRTDFSDEEKKKIIRGSARGRRSSGQ